VRHLLCHPGPFSIPACLIAPDTRFAGHSTSLKVDFQGSRVTSNGCLILVSELDERLGLEKLNEEYLSDSRQGMNKQFTLFELDM
jgi:hypothetical protein